MDVVATDTWDVPYLTQAPISPLEWRKAFTIDDILAWLPKDVDVFGFADGFQRRCSPLAVSPCWVFLPDALVVEIEADFIGIEFERTADKFDVGADLSLDFMTKLIHRQDSIFLNDTWSIALSGDKGFKSYVLLHDGTYITHGEKRRILKGNFFQIAFLAIILCTFLSF